MRLFKWLGVLLGSLHIVLYFLVPDYFSIMDAVVPAVIGVPTMFVFGYLWPLLLFFAFAPQRFHEQGETQMFISGFGRFFGVRDTNLRAVSLVLLWPFTLVNDRRPDVKEIST